MAVSTISKDFIVKTYSVTTASNSSVSPFGAYVDFKDASAPSGYKAVSATLSAIGSTNPAACRIYNADGRGFVYSRNPGTFDLIIVYVKS